MRSGWFGGALALSVGLTPLDVAAEELKVHFPVERSTQFYALGVAEALGFLAEENVDLAFVPRPGKYDAADLLPTQGARLIVLSMYETAYALGAEIPISPVYQISYVAPYSLVAGAGGVADAAALAGATIGIARETDAYIARISAAAAGIGRDGFQTAVIGEDPAALARALADGTVAALALPDRDRAAVEATGAAIVDITPEAVARAPGLAFVMHQLTYEEVRAPVEGFLRAWNKATLVGEQDPALVEAIMRDWAAAEWADEAFGKALLARALAANVQIGAVRGELQQKPWLDAQKPLVKAKVILLPALPSAFLNATSLEAANDFDTASVAAAIDKWKADNPDKLK